MASDVVVLPPHVGGQEAGDDDAQDLEDGDADADSGHGSNVAQNDRFKLGEATLGVDGVGGSLVVHAEDAVAAVVGEGEAAAVRHVASLAEVGSLPVAEALDAATLEVRLDCVPGFLDTGMSFLLADRVVLHPLDHALAHELPGIALEDIDGDSQSDFDQEDEGHEGGIGVEHAGILSASSAASEEGDDEDDAADDDEDDRRVQVGASQEVEVVLQLDLGVGSDADEESSGDEEQEVEEEDDVLEHRVAAVGHREA